MSTPMKATAEGTFAKTPLANVLLYSRERKMSGSLVLTIQPDSPEAVATTDVAGISTLVLEQGNLVAVETPSRAENLPWVLHELGLLSEDAFVKVQQSLMEPASGDEVSTLLRLRAADMSAIERGLRELARRRVASLFGHPGTYAYYAGVDLLAGAGRLRAPEDVLPIVWRGFVAMPPDPAAVSAIIDKLGARALRLREANEFERFEFGEELGLAPTQLRTSASSLDQLVGLSPDGDLVRRMVYLLALTKQVEVVVLGQATASSLSMPPSLPPRPPPVPAKPAPPPVPGAAKPPPPPVPGARPSSTSSPAVRPASASSSAVAPVSASSPAIPSVEPPPNDPSAHPQWKEAHAHLARMQHKNYFQMLDLPDSATVDEVRAAFPKVAAPWHPDRAPIPELQSLYEEVFALYNTAQSTLTEKTSRAAYEETLGGGGGTPAAQKKVAAVLDTVQDVHRAEIAMRRRDYVEAERLLRAVIAASEDDVAAAMLLAQCLLESDPSRHADEVVTSMVKVLNVTDHASDRAWYLLGMAVKTKGDLKRAHASFKRALEANPGNIDASREARLIEMRVQQQRDARAAEKSIGGLLNKFLKK